MLSLDLERLHERARQLGRISRAAEQAARHLPEGARGERRQPPGPPPLQGAPRHSEPLLELRRSRGSRAVAQGARQDDHRAQVDLATEESHRGWGHPLSAARRSTAEAPPAPVLLAQVAWPTAGLPGVGGAIQASPASRTRSGASLVGQVRVDFRQEPIEPQCAPHCLRRRRVAHWSLLHVRKQKERLSQRRGQDDRDH